MTKLIDVLYEIARTPRSYDLNALDEELHTKSSSLNIPITDLVKGIRPVDLNETYIHIGSEYYHPADIAKLLNDLERI